MNQQIKKLFAVKYMVNADEARGLSGSDYTPSIDVNNIMWHTSSKRSTSYSEASNHALKIVAWRNPQIIEI